jgi:hypothetical protein
VLDAIYAAYSLIAIMTAVFYIARGESNFLPIDLLSRTFAAFITY